MNVHVCLEILNKNLIKCFFWFFFPLLQNNSQRTISYSYAMY